MSEWIGISGAAFLALGLGTGGGLVRIGLSLMGLACLIEWRRLWAVIRSEPLAWVAAIFSGYLLASLVVHVTLFGHDLGTSMEGLQSTLVHTGVLSIMVGWVLRGERRLVLAMLLIALVGLLITLFSHSHPTALLAYLGGQRAHYHLGGNGPGVYFGTALIGVLTLGLGAFFRVRPGLGQFAAGLLLSLGAVTLIVPVVFNQSRSAWLALLIVLPLVLALQIIYGRRQRAKILNRSWAAALMALVMIALGLYFLQDVMTKRIHDERAVVMQLAAGSSVAAESSIGYRIHLWKVAYASFLEHPIIGHGPGSAAGIIEEAMPATPFPHFHNLYLQILAEAGLLGFAGAAMAYGLIIQALYRGWRSRLIKNDMVLFLGGTWLFFLLISFFQIRHDDIRGLAYLSMLMGASYTCWLHRHVESPADLPART